MNAPNEFDRPKSPKIINTINHNCCSMFIKCAVTYTSDMIHFGGVTVFFFSLLLLCFSMFCVLSMQKIQRCLEQKPMQSLAVRFCVCVCLFLFCIHNTRMLSSSFSFSLLHARIMIFFSCYMCCICMIEFTLQQQLD